jgi:hypothetical protein
LTTWTAGLSAVLLCIQDVDYTCSKEVIRDHLQDLVGTFRTVRLEWGSFKDALCAYHRWSVCPSPYSLSLTMKSWVAANEQRMLGKSNMLQCMFGGGAVILASFIVCAFRPKVRRDSESTAPLLHS